MKSIKQSIFILLAIFSVGETFGQMVHPGISHKLSDLDRMKYMVEAGIEPWATTFQNLSSHGRAQHDYVVNVVNQDPSYVTEYSAASDGWFINDGTAAYYNALMWYITGDSRHADKAVEIFNTYKGLTRNTTGIPLESGRVWRIIEAAEIIEHTYDGWAASDIQDFKDMLVYPGYSNTTVPTAAIASNDITFYWKIYNGDPARHGNQGLFAMRTMMAMAIFLDNDIMYDRALRYLEGQSHRSDDLEYPSGPSINGTTNISGCSFFEEYTRSGEATTITDYGYNEVIDNYVFSNGQSQESSRDQAHALAGVNTIAVMAEMAWSQGDDLYGHLDNRPLLGLEFFYRYNLSSHTSYSDQTTPWEPTVASGEYIERTDRSGRWRALEINPGVNCDQANITRGQNDLMPVYEMNLGHYRDRMNLPSDDYKWLERGHDYLTSQIGVEGEGVVTDHPGYGGLKFRRVSPGDPISGFDSKGLPIYEMNVLPMTIEAENFDYFSTSGENHTYNDTGSGNSGSQYRTDENVDIQVCSEGGYNIGWTSAGEYLTYTVYVPSTGPYNIDARVASPSGSGQLRVEFDGVDKTGDVAIPNTGGWQSWQTQSLANQVLLSKGVHQLKLHFVSGGLNLNNISVTRNNLALGQATDQSSDRPSDGFAENAVDGDTNGAWSGGSVSHTLTDTNPWWEVDLGSDQNIGEIVIYGRTDSCCAARLSDYTVTVIDNGNNVVFSENVTDIPVPYKSVDAEGSLGRVVRITMNDTNVLALAEVEVYAGNGATTPVAGKTYYIDNPYWDLRLGADGTEDAYTTSTSTTGANVEWTITASPTADFFYVDCNGGGSVPRIRTDRTADADMQATSSSGNWTRWEFTNTGNDSFYMTVLDNSSYERLQFDSAGDVKMVNETLTGDWEMFTFTEVPNPTNTSAAAPAREYIEKFTEDDSSITIYPNPVKDIIQVSGLTSKYSQYSICNIYGEKVLNGSVSVENSKLSIDMTKLSSGIYILNLIGSQDIESHKVVKE